MRSPRAKGVLGIRIIFLVEDAGSDFAIVAGIVVTRVCVALLIPTVKKLTRTPGGLGVGHGGDVLARIVCKGRNPVTR